jgi:uncharacterized membrane protein (UPF0127 family)
MISRTNGKQRIFDTRALATAITLLAVGGVLLVTTACSYGNRDGPKVDAWLEINGKKISVEIADTPRVQEKGLGERDSLAWNHGMYFEYSKPAFYAFWMKGMRFSIDIIWLRDDRIVDVDANVPFEKGGNGPTLRPSELVDAVLEVPAGYAAASGWQIGDRMILERVTAK